MKTPREAGRRLLLRALPQREQRFLAEALREETVGGVLMLAAAVVAVVWASSPWEGLYQDLRAYELGPQSLHLQLSLHAWAADGLLAVFFFVAGLELKRELVVGQLRRPAEAVLPMAAAVSGMVIPAAFYLALTFGEPESRGGWAVPIATDIAFALAVLAVAGRALPTSLRAFLLTLAVVDDLGAVLVIAVAFTESLRWEPLVAAGAIIAAYVWLQRSHRVHGALVLAAGVLTWVLVHESGVHPTVAGVALGLATRAKPRRDEHTSPVEHLEHVVRPFSAGVAVPLFALLAAGVSVSPDHLSAAAADQAALGVTVALVAGKFLGVLGGTWATARWTRAELSADLRWADIGAAAALSGIGFTVALLMTELSFPAARQDSVKTAVLVASAVSALLAIALLRWRTSRR